ncbi:carbohydrate kinase [Domibacillus indicus]|uniref:carbohydrate kinase family protein n=1 Tax=Domibacillus indicus TaxID=1437523 RepID=UPI00203B9AEB|nr:carbohydrate kinase [Domibacillus indicus]MCM3789762.1 carbohydrate kinase [Domibacillus indicus]
MAKVFCIGEALIDFIPVQKDTSLKNVAGFERVAGGAPMNVAIAVAKYGGEAAMITKMANDHFGEHLMDVLQEHHVDTAHIVRSDEGETGLAFVSVDKTGERSFTFYRENAADLLLKEEEIEEDWFGEGDLLHFCSVNLIHETIRETHKKAINSCRKKGGIISFDPNVRLPLWEDEESCREAIREFLPMADLIKISDEELFFITGIEEEGKAISSLFAGNVKAVIFTKGKNGASLFLEGGQQFHDPGFQVAVTDTTGAGDAFIGGFLSKLMELNVHSEGLVETINTHHTSLLSFANASGALAASVKGAICAAIGKKDVLNLAAAQRNKNISTINVTLLEARDLIE